MNQFNPFIIEGYKSPEYFCDRQEETAILTDHLTNQRNVALIAKRRLGKSGLILNCFNQKVIADNYYTFYIDIYDTKNLAELTYELGKGILGLNQPIGKITTPDVLLDEIFYYLEHAEKPCLVALDEFQVVADYPEKTAEATLRKRIQNCHNVHFIYSGSKRHMMAEMFVSSARPFYNSAALMGLEPINKDAYLDFANCHFSQNAQSMSKAAFYYLYERFEGVTWYIQYVLNVLYATKKTELELDEKDINDAVETILQGNAFAYRTMLYQIAPKQKELLRAIAKEGKVESIMSKDFLNKYSMTSSQVQGALKVLLDRDFVTNEEEAYYVYDRFFELWLRK